MVYQRLPRNSHLPLTREQLRVYMKCDGQRSLEDIVHLTKLTMHDVSNAIQDLLHMNLLTDSLREAQAAPEIQLDFQAAATPAPLTERLAHVLEQQLGNKAAPYLAQLHACPDENALHMLVPRLIAKIKLTVNREAADALQDEYQRTH